MDSYKKVIIDVREKALSNGIYLYFLPTCMHVGRVCIDWTNSIGCPVKIDKVYENGRIIDLTVVIERYDKKTQNVYFVGYEKGIRTSHLIEGHIGTIFTSIAITHLDQVSFFVNTEDAHKYTAGSGKKVLLAAGDTFRAAAIDQLSIWADRCGVDMIKQGEGSDPAAVLFDACRAAKARNVDVLICDTAGRLHNKKNLMDELAKMSRVVAKEMPDIKHETFLVLDSTTGQNAVNQARAFSEVANISGIILTKLDGSSKGGIIVSICNELKIPVRLVGVGEGIDDMQPFSPEDYVKALFE